MIRKEDLVGGPRGHRFNVNNVDVVIVKHQHVTVASGGESGEAAGLIDVDLVGCAMAGCVHVVGAAA